RRSTEQEAPPESAATLGHGLDSSMQPDGLRRFAPSTRVVGIWRSRARSLGRRVPPADRSHSQSIARAAGHRRQDDDRVARTRRRRQLREVAHVLAVEIHVDEPVEHPVAGEELIAELRETLDELLEDLAHGGTLELDLLVPVSRLAQDRRDADDRHARVTLAFRVTLGPRP